MEEIFDQSKTTRDVELELANAEWRKNLGTVTLDAEREGLFDGFNDKIQTYFDQGLNIGFEAVKKIGVFKGRLMKIQSHNGSNPIVVELIEELRTTEADIVRWLASQKPNISGSNGLLDPIYTDKVLRLQERVELTLLQFV